MTTSTKNQTKNQTKDGIYKDKAETKYIVRYNARIKVYNATQLQPNNERIPNAQYSFTRWTNNGGLIKCQN